MAKHSSKKERAAIDPYITLTRWEFKCPAFRALTGDQSRVYMAMRFRYNGRNNGEIRFSSRDAGDAIGKSYSTGARAVLRLTALGFIKPHRDYTYGQKRKCREYELTAISLKPAERASKLPVGTRDFMRWTSEEIEALDAETLATQKTKHSVTRASHSSAGANEFPKVVSFQRKQAQ